jgi:tetratricopeptide (TPR) repeat protein
MKKLRYLSAALLALTLALPASGNEDRYKGMDKDEAGLWFAMDKAEDSIKTSGARITDPELNDYIQNLTCEIVGEACSDLRIYLVNSPDFNAAMAPNGMMLVNSGLLLRAENEAQLGCVIGHEYGHFAQGHSLKQWRAIKDVGNANIFLPIAGALIGMASLSEFSREQEREADQIGFDKIAKYGYESAECSKVWGNLIGESEKSVVKRVRKRSQKTKNGVFASHPVPKERLETLSVMASETPGGDKVGKDVYLTMTHGFLAKWLENELIAKDFDRHIYLFEELKSRGRHAATLDYYLGEAYRLRRQEGDKEKAMEYWQMAAAGENPPVDVWRAMAEYNRRAKNKAQALSDYKTYLMKAPDAPDRALIEKYIDRLQTES